MDSLSKIAAAMLTAFGPAITLPGSARQVQETQLMRDATEATEALSQWRAVAILEDGREQLLVLGPTPEVVRARAGKAFRDVLSDAEQAQVRSVMLQRWEGIPFCGRWMPQSSLPIPQEA